MYRFGTNEKVTHDIGRLYKNICRGPVFNDNQMRVSMCPVHCMDKLLNIAGILSGTCTSRPQGVLKNCSFDLSAFLTELFFPQYKHGIAAFW